MNWKRSSSSQRPKGLTLLEVVVSLVLLATLLVGSLMAHGRHVRQVKRAKLRLEAVQGADRLLTEWFREVERVPKSSRGPIAGSPALAWRTESIPDVNTEPLAVEVVRLTVTAMDAGPADPPLTHVDVLVPRPAAQDASGRNGSAQEGHIHRER